MAEADNWADEASGESAPKVISGEGAAAAELGRVEGQGREAAKTHIQENPELADELTQLIMEKVHPKAGESLTGDSDEAEAEE